ncbi:MAG: MgtC/SapB family protein, partial [Pseudomonadota bacterium]
MQIVTRMPLELVGEVSIYFGIGLQVLMALLLGGLVGFDREKKLKSAGIKTNILICLGATLYTSLGVLISSTSDGAGDPARMAAQIVSGIGFLGGGAIIQSQGSVVGMTTAATIWVVA